ncbi:MAG TPA: tetratricopeptide repeat protein, partial [Chitinophagaceae bacterium]|nr:tetratricopeptide repeat protein [Chitinophagaceae bacterium]
PLSDSSLAVLLQLQTGMSITNEEAKAVHNRVMSNPKLERHYEWYERGKVQEGHENYDKAIGYYGKAIEKNQEYSGAYYGRGNCYQKLEKYELAIENFNKAIEYNKNWEAESSLYLAYFNRGFAYFDLEPQNNENLAMALKDLSKSIELNSTDANAYYHRGLVNQCLGNLKEAIADFKKSNEIDTDNNNLIKSNSVTSLIKCYTELGEQEEIKKWRKKSLELAEENADFNISNNKNDNKTML